MTTFRRWGIEDWRAFRSKESPEVVTLRWQPAEGNEVRLTMGSQWNAAQNLRVLYLAAEAIRMNEVRGIGGILRDAYLQLAAPLTERDPYEVLGVRSDVGLEEIEAVYKVKARRLHPDQGGDPDAMRELNVAMDRIRDERKVPA